MAHQLDFINQDAILQAIARIDKEPIPKNNEWSEYSIKYKSKLYQFKYTVEVASTFTDTPIKTSDFTSNDSSRNYIASLGFHILYRSPNSSNSQVNYWVGASYYGLPGNQIDKFDDFIKNKYWRTDHDLSQGEGLKIYNELVNVNPNDRICIRYFDKKGGRVHIAKTGTVIDINKIEDGRLGVVWDYNSPEYKGEKPSGYGSGNWWKTLFQLTRHSDIDLIFSETFIEKRVARIAWNDLGWVMPSGSEGKSAYPDSHEAKFGYGHEEWLFDTNKLISGFHYGFLEPIRKQQDAFANKIYDVWLYTINGDTKKRFWIGEIKNLIVIDSKEADTVKETYLKKGWFAEMEEQIKKHQSDAKGFSNWQGVDLFNVKFKPNQIFVNDPYFELSKKHPLNDQSRYSFGHFEPQYMDEIEDTIDNFTFTQGGHASTDVDPKIKQHYRQPRAIEIIYLHRAISNSLTRKLQEIYGKSNVTREHPAGYGTNKIDIVVNQKHGLTFYEIKTYNSIKTSIREAFGQLMEYCFYPNQHKAIELIIVTQLPADDLTKKYFDCLRQKLKLPLYYQSYDLKTKQLSDKY